eukprot:3122551-Pyramimonas_sp.AAC.1
MEESEIGPGGASQANLRNTVAAEMLKLKCSNEEADVQAKAGAWATSKAVAAAARAMSTDFAVWKKHKDTWHMFTAPANIETSKECWLTLVDGHYQLLVRTQPLPSSAEADWGKNAKPRPRRFTGGGKTGTPSISSRGARSFLGLPTPSRMPAARYLSSRGA